MRSRRSLTALLMLLSAACAMLTEPTGDAPLRIETEGSVLRLSNDGRQSVYYTAFERDYAALVLWAPCVDPTTCRTVAPGASVQLPYSSISGYQAGKEAAVVYWWHLVPAAEGGFEPDSIRSAVVRF